MSVKVLCVDDEPNVLEACQRNLRKRFSIDTALGGEPALALLASQGPYAVIVTDMQMPKMGGSQLITALKGKAETCNIPIFIVAGKQSGFENKEKRADFAIFKDINIEEQLGKALQSLTNLSTRIAVK